MPPCHPFRPVPGQCGPNRRGPLPAPPFDPRDYWATRKLVSSLSASLEAKLDKADVVDPGAAAEAGKAADAKSTYEELNRILAKLAKKADKATTLAGYGITDAATKTEIAAKADLVGGKVPSAQLPSYVDDVLEYDSMSAFPATGENSKIYVAKDTNLVYRWSGTQYVEISPSPTLDDTVTKTSSNGVKSSGIWSWVKSLLPQWLTSDYAEPATVASVKNKADKTELDAKRDKTDLSVYTVTGYDYSAFEKVREGSYGVEIISYHGGTPYRLQVYDLDTWDVFGASVETFNSWEEASEWFDAYKPFVVTGSSLVPDGTVVGPRRVVSDNLATASQLAAKFDKTGGRIGPTDETGEQTLPQTVVRIGRDAAHNLGSGGKLVIASGTGNGGDVIVSAGPEDDVANLDVFGDIFGNSGEIRVHKGFSAGTGNGHLLITHTGDGNETLTDRIRRDAGSLVSTNNPAFVSAVQNTPTSGMPEDMPTADWGTFGTVGAALAALAAGLKWCKNILGSLASGYSTFAAWIASKLDRASLFPEYSSTSAYSVGAIVSHDGNIYQCKTAISDGGEAWNAEHWELRKLDGFFTNSNSLLTGTIDEEIIEKGTAPDAHLEAPTDERLKLILADNSVAYDSAKALPYKLTSVIGDRVVATMTLNAASTDITLPTIAVNDTTVKDFILDVTNAYAVEGVATDAGINIPRTDFKLVTRDGESLTDVTTVKAGKSAFLCFTQKAPVVVDGTTYPCWCVIQLPFGDPS